MVSHSMPTVRSLMATAIPFGRYAGGASRMNLLTAARDSKNTIKRVCDCIQIRAPLQEYIGQIKGNI